MALTYRVEIENDLNGPYFAVIGYDLNIAVFYEDGFSNREAAQKRADELQIEEDEEGTDYKEELRRFLNVQD